ncbi:hypothetical protein, variant [Aphanomyces invadans]|uniref:Uncharacterized protein n=1 Tax=Aphanomyces invadans TaxID=157072 RepID=A0A024TEZ0_9STRA|nr:hypothetical protein, variant [Aphanomyces invadans]ETV92579.1 hypothetical protein, variant [Aphanomyces invadans]|eukprot:XP_008878886.1 hypothetical protein, variant [Aphanomyces invadans]
MVFRVAAPQVDTDHDHDLEVKLSNRGFDLMSHEIIEQRLENLKRKPKWSDWLDAYVRSIDHDGDGNDDDEWTPKSSKVTSSRHDGAYLSRSGFIAHVFWTVVALLFAPFIVLFCAPFQRFYTPDMWPLGCNSPTSFIKQGVLNACTIVLIVAVAYRNLCDEFPSRNMEANIALVHQHVAVLYWKLHHCAHEMHVSKDVTGCCFKWFQGIVEGGGVDAEWPILMPRECLGPIIEAAMIVASVGLLFKFYHKWSRYAIFTYVVIQYTTSSVVVQSMLSPQPTIVALEPEYAMVDEELVVSIDGAHLQAGGTIGWIPFWCSPSTYGSDAFVGDCDKQFEAPFENGVVHVMFRLVDTYIPCYKNPPNPLQPPVYQCFDSVPLRVKDRQSIPGLFKAAPASPPASITVEISANAL